MKHKARKILDTVENYGAAEQYIDFNVDFVRFLRNRYNVAEIRNIDANYLAKKYNLKGFVFGNYVTQEERYFYLFKIARQLEYLAKIKGSNNLGKGILIIAFGAEGLSWSNAHYSPKKQIINLNRGRKADYKEFMKGENSFVHEYGHFLDFYQGHVKDKSLNYNFASENLNSKWSNKTTLLFSSSVNTVFENIDYIKQLPTPYYKKTVEVFARLFEAAITHYLHKKYPESKLYFDRSYTEVIYYPKNLIHKQKLGSEMVKILKQV